MYNRGSFCNDFIFYFLILMKLSRVESINRLGAVGGVIDLVKSKEEELEALALIEIGLDIEDEDWPNVF
jgi:hypothetical protein